MATKFSLKKFIWHLHNSTGAFCVWPAVSTKCTEFVKGLACSAGLFWAGKAAWLCSYCCNRYLWCYDVGRLDCPIFSSLFEFQHCAFGSKTFARPMKTHALQTIKGQVQTLNFSVDVILKPENFRFFTSVSTASIWDTHLRFFLVSGIVGNGKLSRPSRIISIPDIWTYHHTEPDEFWTGGKFVRFGVPFTPWPYENLDA